MRILLIAPASRAWRRIGHNRLFNGRTFRFSLLSLQSVAAETPPGHTVRIVDEQVDVVPLEDPVDLVGITAMTAAAPRAYALAAAFRRRGVPVVLGGMHPTFLPDEALEHADAVVRGDAEGVWPRVVEDAAAGRLRGIYTAEAPPSLAGLKPVPRHLLRRGSYATLYAVQATRGCPHRCAFCSVSAFHGGSQRQRPVEEVAREVAAIPARRFIFVDDNLTEDRAYAASLFDALTPLGRHWMTQSTLAVAEDEAFVARAARAGCVGMFVGLETFDACQLRAVDKSFNQVAHYRELVGTLQRHGIGVEAGLVFGFDGDDPGVFERTLAHVEALAIDAIQVSIFTPLPGTPRYTAMADRIFDRNWEHYDFHHAVFEPRGMSAAQLKDGHDWLVRAFYRPGAIARRLGRIATRPNAAGCLPFAVAVNGAYYGRVRRWGIRGRNPAGDPRPATLAKAS